MQQMADIVSVAKSLGIDPNRLGSPRLYVFPPLGVTVPNNGVESNPTSIRFKSDGIMVAFRAAPSTGALVDYAGLESRIQFSGQEELATDGDFGAFVPMLLMCSPYQIAFDLRRCRRVYNGQDVTSRFRNLSTSGPLTPHLAIEIIEVV